MYASGKALRPFGKQVLKAQASPGANLCGPTRVFLIHREAFFDARCFSKYYASFCDNYNYRSRFALWPERGAQLVKLLPMNHQSFLLVHITQFITGTHMSVILHRAIGRHIIERIRYVSVIR